ncbi:hypothetical protein P7K49_003183 [Saguinus oedipus]|uniref:Uncharacterized protein n=1 Tax=Saguinus oedipus TaxID=9490 RepID=A0ABQ9WJF7_SAGOE|nr:hypothetical protein P7K49_003183 [Saguinus oedipus]
MELHLQADGHPKSRCVPLGIATPGSGTDTENHPEDSSVDPSSGFYTSAEKEQKTSRGHSYLQRDYIQEV